MAEEPTPPELGVVAARAVTHFLADAGVLNPEVDAYHHVAMALTRNASKLRRALLIDLATLEHATTADGTELRDRTARSLGLTGTDEARWLSADDARDEAGRQLYEGEGWDDWGDLPERLRAQWRNVAEKSPERVDEKGRGPTYWRGHADGQLYERARPGELKRVAEDHPSPDAPDGSPLWACPDCGTRAVTDHLPYPATRAERQRRHDDLGRPLLRSDQPPFAPELADAPIVTGESGALVPIVVDAPVHESTLPAELGAGAPCPQCRMRGGRHKMDCTDPARDGPTT